MPKKQINSFHLLISTTTHPHKHEYQFDSQWISINYFTLNMDLLFNKFLGKRITETSYWNIKKEPAAISFSVTQSFISFITAFLERKVNNPCTIRLNRKNCYLKKCGDWILAIKFIITLNYWKKCTVFLKICEKGLKQNKWTSIKF